MKSSFNMVLLLICLVYISSVYSFKSTNTNNFSNANTSTTNTTNKNISTSTKNKTNNKIQSKETPTTTNNLSSTSTTTTTTNITKPTPKFSIHKKTIQVKIDIDKKKIYYKEIIQYIRTNKTNNNILKLLPVNANNINIYGSDIRKVTYFRNKPNQSNKTLYKAKIQLNKSISSIIYVTYTKKLIIHKYFFEIIDIIKQLQIGIFVTEKYISNKLDLEIKVVHMKHEFKGLSAYLGYKVGNNINNTNNSNTFESLSNTHIVKKHDFLFAKFKHLNISKLSKLNNTANTNILLKFSPLPKYIQFNSHVENFLFENKLQTIYTLIIMFYIACISLFGYMIFRGKNSQEEKIIMNYDESIKNSEDVVTNY